MATSKTRKRFSWLISLIVMLAASAALIFASDRVTAAVYGPYQESQPVPTVASMTEMDISGYAADDYQVEMVQTCLDESGAVVGYAVDTWEYGFNSEKPIHLRSTISTDGKLLISVEVLEQHESDYYGDQIGEDWYPGRFDGRLLPVLSNSESGRGSHIDGISGATYTSNAVLRAINNASRFVTEQLS